MVLWQRVLRFVYIGRVCNSPWFPKAFEVVEYSVTRHQEDLNYPQLSSAGWERKRTSRGSHFSTCPAARTNVRDG